ncbi:MAG: flagellar protein [Limnochordia bacterium]|jgi:flagellar operon protein (TIGR03826 family)
MKVKNCPQCGQLFKYTYEKLCPTCREEEHKTFELVRTYLRKHPGATMVEVHQGTGVEMWKLEEYVREGRLMAYSSLQVSCDGCGKMISSGRLCDDCQREIFGGPSSPEEESQQKRQGRLHYRSPRKGYFS